MLLLMLHAIHTIPLDFHSTFSYVITYICILFQVMIFLIDHVLPESYFANNLRALSVDMAVFRELLSVHLPTLSHHLDKLQAAARDHNTGNKWLLAVAAAELL